MLRVLSYGVNASKPRCPLSGKRVERAGIGMEQKADLDYILVSLLGQGDITL